MTIVIEGTTTHNFGQAQNPATHDVTVPASADAVYMFWQYYFNGTGHGLATATLETVPASEIVQVTGNSSAPSQGCAAWYNAGTGSNQTLDVSWDQSPSFDATMVMVFTSGGNLVAVRDYDGAIASGQFDPLSVTIDSDVTDLVMMHNTRYSNTGPATPSGHTSLGTTDVTGGYSSRLSAVDSPGAGSTLLEATSVNYSSMIGLSVAEAGAAPPGPTIPPLAMHHQRQQR